MRPEERERLFREGFDAYQAGDLKRMLALYAEDIEATAPEWMNVGSARGHEAFADWASAWEEAWDEWALEVEEVRAVGERHVVARLRARGRGRSSGVELDREMGEVVDVNDEGLACYLEITLDFNRALEVANEREVSN